MSEFELGMMAGWAMGVVTAGAIAGTLDWWRGRNRVVTIHTTSQPCEQERGMWDPICPHCCGRGVVLDWDKWHCPGTPRATKTCQTCEGSGVIKESGHV